MDANGDKPTKRKRIVVKNEGAIKANLLLEYTDNKEGMTEAESLLADIERLSANRQRARMQRQRKRMQQAYNLQEGIYEDEHGNVYNAKRQKNTYRFNSKNRPLEFWEQDVDLRKRNTMRLYSYAKDFFTITCEQDFLKLYNIYNDKEKGLKGRKIFTLGEGSNTIFAVPEIESVVVSVETQGFDFISSDDDHVWVKCKAGELFRDFVLRMCVRNYSGLENLAGIYGTVGAAPVQNIGAYGCEVKDCIDSVTYFDMKDGKFYTISNKECNFGYRDSIFKHQDGNKIISDVVFRLNKSFVVNDSYDAVRKCLGNIKKDDITPLLVAQKIVEIRNGKLPDPKVLGNSGSFFKNPVVSAEHFNRLKAIYVDIVGFDDDNGKKISAAWLIKTCGFCNKKENGLSVYKKQPLVLVNYGIKNNQYLIDFAETIKKTVKVKFDIDLVAEPHFVY